MSKLTVSNASFAYGHKTVLHTVNLSTQEGEFLGIIGPNGSGKTTLLRAMAGLLRCSTGNVLLNGTDIRSYRREEIARQISFVPQSAVLPELFTALEIVLMGRLPHLGLIRYESSHDIYLALQAMEATMTAHLSERRVKEISGGEKQRIVIARALAQEAKLLLLDEPTANLDINYQSEILAFLRELCRNDSISVIAALHDLNLAAQYCDRLILLGGGTVFRQGTPHEVIETNTIKEVYGADVLICPHPINGLPSTLIAPPGRCREN